MYDPEAWEDADLALGRLDVQDDDIGDDAQQTHAAARGDASAAASAAHEDEEDGEDTREDAGVHAPHQAQQQQPKCDDDDTHLPSTTGVPPQDESNNAQQRDWMCPICLTDVPFVETAIVKGCNHLFCANCILNWVAFKDKCICPSCRNPFDVLLTHRSLNGTISDELGEEPVSLLLRAEWFDNKVASSRKGKGKHASLGGGSGRKIYGADDYAEAELDGDWDDYGRAEYDEEDYYCGSSSSRPRVRIGNRRWGANGYVAAGRMQARPSVQSASGSSSHAHAHAHAHAHGSPHSPHSPRCAAGAHWGGAKGKGRKGKSPLNSLSSSPAQVTEYDYEYEYKPAFESCTVGGCGLGGGGTHGGKGKGKKLGRRARRTAKRNAIDRAVV